MRNSLMIVLRECGEKTADQSFNTLCQGFGKECVVRVSERPFSAALAKSLQLGIDSGAELLLCVDADVIPDIDGLTELVDQFISLPRHLLEIQGMIYDNLFRILRPAGNHLYRTTLLKKALNCIPHEGASLRPESEMLSRMTRKGHPWFQSRVFVGYHDFGQAHEDVYRKAFLHAKKHQEYRTYLTDLWTGLSGVDEQFLVALSALKSASEFDGEVFVSKSFQPQFAEKALKDLGLEPSGIKAGEIDSGEIQARIQQLPTQLEARARDCQADIHRRIFNSRSAYLRRLLSNKIVSWGIR